MDAKINIAKILKDKPQGTKLYSSACGKCELKEADDKSVSSVTYYYIALICVVQLSVKMEKMLYLEELRSKAYDLRIKK